MTWDPRKHPRIPGGPHGGEFAEGWLGKVSDAVGRVPWVRAKDRVRGGKRGFNAKEIVAGARQRAGNDPMLSEIYELQRYHAKPEVIDKAEMDQRVASGWTEVWRGFGTRGSAVHAEAFRSGDEHYVGQGMHGNGTYTSTSPYEIADYTDPNHFDMPGYRTFSALPADEQDRLVQDDARWPGRARIAIHPDAKVVDIQDLRADWRQDTAGLKSWDLQVLADDGRYAALRGYDVIRIPGGYYVWGSPLHGKVEDAPDHYIVLNRGAVAVQEAAPEGY